VKIKVQEKAFHRNGISGLGFCVIRFQWIPEDCDKEENFLAILFDEPGACAVIGLDRIEEQGIAFAKGNSWRGDHFEAELRKAIKESDEMTLEGIRKAVKQIEDCAEDFEVAHGLEDTLHLTFIDHVANCNNHTLSEMAKEVLKTEKIKFERFCA